MIFDFEGHPLSDADPVAGDDASEAAWVPLVDVPELDLVAGLLLALDRGRVGEIYIVGGERPVSKRE